MRHFEGQPRCACRARRRRAASTRLLPCWLVLPILLSPLCANAGNLPDDDPFAPTVTAREARILEQVSSLAPTNSAAALKLLTEAIGRKSSAALDFALGNVYFQKEDYPAAQTAYETALGKLPHFRSAKSNLGRIYLLQNETDKAIAIYQTLVKNGQAGASVLLLLGHALLIREHVVSAENAYRQTLLLEPGNSEAMLGLAKCLLQQERHKEALGLLRELLGKDPARKDLWSLRAQAHLAEDQPDKALISLESARRLKQASPEMLATLGDLYLNRQQPEDAVATYREAFASDMPSLLRILRSAEGFIMIDQDKYAMELLARAESVAKDTGKNISREDRRYLLRLKGDFARLKGDVPAATTIYEELLQENPLDGRVLITLGDLRREQGKLEEAIMAYERAARTEGHEAKAMIRQAQAEIERERYPLAVKLLEAALAFEHSPRVQKYLDQVRRLAEISSPPE